MLAHSSGAITADIYTSVLPEFQKEAAAAIAALIAHAYPQPGRQPRKRRAGLTMASHEATGGASRSCRPAKPQVNEGGRGALGGIRTPNLLIRRFPRRVRNGPFEDA
jgi:hypothetical protein